jgi:hypothetical protein
MQAAGTHSRRPERRLHSRASRVTRWICWPSRPGSRGLLPRTWRARRPCCRGVTEKFSELILLYMMARRHARCSDSAVRGRRADATTAGSTSQRRLEGTGLPFKKEKVACRALGPEASVAQGRVRMKKMRY